MSLQQKIAEIQSKHLEARNKIGETLGERGTSAIDATHIIESENIILALNEHFENYQGHRELVFGQGESLEKRAEYLLQDEFGIRDKQGNLKTDHDGNVLYEKVVWKTKRFKEKVIKSELTKEILSVAGHLLSNLGERGQLIFSRYPDNTPWQLAQAFGITLSFMGGGFGTIVGIVGFALTHNPEFLLLAGGGAGAISMPFALNYSLPIKTQPVLSTYLKAAREADTFLQTDVKKYLTRSLHPYRGEAICH